MKCNQCHLGDVLCSGFCQKVFVFVGTLSPQVGAWIVWVVALIVEHKADLQKKAFVRQCAKDQVTLWDLPEIQASYFR